MNYFICDKRDLSPAYVKSCEKFLKSINKQRTKKNSRLQLLKSLDEAASLKLQASSALKRTQLKDKIKT
jgi:hypothetical protein